jgi:hypothetical protein
MLKRAPSSAAASAAKRARVDDQAVILSLDNDEIRQQIHIHALLHVCQDA